MPRKRDFSKNNGHSLPRKRKVYSRLTNPAYGRFRKMVLMRDSFCCQYPGCDKKRRLEVHHIRKYSSNKRLRTEPLNGITLCQECHRKITGKEEKYEDMLQTIASRNHRRVGNTRGTNATFQNKTSKKTSRKTYV